MQKRYKREKSQIRN